MAITETATLRTLVQTPAGAHFVVALSKSHLPCLVLVEPRKRCWTDCDEAGDYIVPNVLSPRDLVFRPDNMDKTVPHTHDASDLGNNGRGVKHNYTPNFEKVDGAYCFWSVRAWVRGSHFLYLL